MEQAQEVELLDRLYALQVFKGLPKEAVKEISRAAQYQSAPPEHHLIIEGESSEDLLILLSGLVSVRLESISPYVEVGITKIRPGEVIGEMSFLESGLRSASIVAVEDCEYLILSHDQLMETFESHPDWGMIFMKNIAVALSARLRKMNRRILNLMRARYF